VLGEERGELREESWERREESWERRVESWELTPSIIPLLCPMKGIILICQV